MAKVKVKFSAAQESLRRRFKEATRQKKLLKDIGETVVKNAKAEVRLGKDPETSQKLPPFQSKNQNGVKAYVRRRRDIARENGSGRNFKPRKANMTITGQLLESIVYKILGNGLIIMEPSDEPRKAYKGQENTPSNRDLVRWHQQGGTYPKRNVIGVSEKTQKTVKNKIRAFLRRTVLKR